MYVLTFPFLFSFANTMLTTTQTIFAVNAGSNTLTMLEVSKSDPTCLTVVGEPAALTGEFPNTVAASAKNKLACVGTTGAKAGIGIGAVVGGLALIGLGVWGFLRWRRNKADGVSGFLPWGRKEVGHSGPADKPELDGAGKALAEKDGTEVDKRDVQAGGLPAVGVEDGEGRDGLSVPRNLNAEGEVVELP